LLETGAEKEPQEPASAARPTEAIPVAISLASQDSLEQLLAGQDGGLPSQMAAPMMERSTWATLCPRSRAIFINE
jgi:hypothetical protein